MELKAQDLANRLTNMRNQLQSVAGLVRQRETELAEAEALMHRWQGAIELTAELQQQAAAEEQQIAAMRQQAENQKQQADAKDQQVTDLGR